MIAANEIDKTLEIYEIKRNRKNIDFKLLEEKKNKLLASVPSFEEYDIVTKGLDIDDM